MVKRSKAEMAFVILMLFSLVFVSMGFSYRRARGEFPPTRDYQGEELTNIKYCWDTKYGWGGLEPGIYLIATSIDPTTIEYGTYYWATLRNHTTVHVMLGNFTDTALASAAESVKRALDYAKKDIWFPIRQPPYRPGVEVSGEGFVSIVICRGVKPTGGYEITCLKAVISETEIRIHGNFTDRGEGITVIQVTTYPSAMISLKKLPPGSYSITIDIDRYVRSIGSTTYIGSETWTASFKIT